MKNIPALVTRHRKIIMIAFIAAAVLCALLSTGVQVNYNVVDYLPASAQSTKALSVMKQEFTDAVPNARVMLRGVTVSQALEYKHTLGQISGVSDVIWLDDIVDLRIPLETASRKTVENYYKDGNALISLTVREGEEIAVTDRIYELIGENNALSGAASDKAAMQKMAGSETAGAMVILLPVIILILAAATSSWLEPMLFLGAIGVSVIINMGTNLLFDNVSFITRSVSPILQLAVSLDYAIFLLHSFDDYRRQTDDVEEAMRLAMKRAFPAVMASAATTFFGFLALAFMDFEIGADLGLNLVKGIVFSFISVMVFLPALTLNCYKLIDKTKHKKILPEFRNAGKILTRVGVFALIITAVLIVPGYLAQTKNSFIYGSGGLNTNMRSGQDTVAIDEEFGKSTVIVLLVPKGDSAREQELCDELKSLESVDQVVSYVTMVGAVIPEQYLPSAVTKNFYSQNYCRILVYTNTGEEGEHAFAVVENVQGAARRHYGDAAWSCGSSVNLYDMRSVVTQDNTRVNLIAVIAIFAVLLATFKSLTLPLLLLVTIETAIWVNLAVPYFMGSTLCYIGFLVINTVQLGATVDYAILLSDNYMQKRMLLPKKQAMLETLGGVFNSILISASILSLAGLCLNITSSNPIVSELGMLLSRGTLMSMLMVLCFLPAALTLFDRVIEKTTLKTRFFKERSV